MINMYTISKLTGKIYLNNIEIVQDDRLEEWQEMYRWVLNGGIFEEIENTPEELIELNKPKIPEIITRRQFKIALAVLGYNENNILDGINQLPEPNKTIARISYNESGTFERYSQDLIFVAKSFLNLTDQQIDEVFLTAITF